MCVLPPELGCQPLNEEANDLARCLFRCQSQERASLRIDSGEDGYSRTDLLSRDRVYLIGEMPLAALEVRCIEPALVNVDDCEALPE